MPYFFFFLLGFFSIISQVTIIRELIVSFYGNELFSGIVLAIWVLGSASGSFLALRLKKFRSRKKILLLFLLLVFAFPMQIILLRFLLARTLLLGEIPSLWQSLIFVFFLLYPFCFILGALFSWSVYLKNQKKKQSRAAQVISRGYMLETVGLALGGLFFNFFLITSNFPLPRTLNNQSLKFRFPNLVDSVNSLYGNIIVTQEKGQHNFYENGQLMGSSDEWESNEYFSHLILSQHQEPKNILIIGGGLNGLMGEILKYESVEKLDYVELDPKLIEVGKKYLSGGLLEIFKSPKVKINLFDGRRFLTQAKSQYDLVIFNLANPSTALLNRYYTKECYQLVKKILNKNGIFAASISAPVDYLSREAKNLVTLINQTIKSVFPYQLTLAEESEILFLASGDDVLTRDIDLLKQRFLERKISTQFFTPDYLEYRLKSEKIKQIEDVFKESKTFGVNTDFYPLAYFSQTLFWQTMFSFRTAKIFSILSAINFKILLFVFAATFFLFFFLIKKPAAISFTAVFLSAVTLMSFEILIIFLFQSALGYVFSKIALIFTVILTALAGGNYWTTKFASKLNKKALEKVARLLKAIIFFIIIYCLLFMFIIGRLRAEPSFYFLAAIIGFLIGAVFPLANKLMMVQEERSQEKSGFLYGADLLGAFISAGLTSIFLIPVFGVFETIYLLLFINIFSFILLQKKLGQ